MARRVTLPGADELFRSTSATETAADVSPHAVESPNPTLSRSGASRRQAPGPSGRERHAEKITVYVSDEELIDLERTRLTLRASHGLGVDRGRIVREALSVVLADFDAKGPDSILVRRLKP